jgi:hypothetical protein
MQRRSFLAGILAAAVAPAIARSGVLMPVKPPIWTPPTTGFIRVDQAFGESHSAIFTGEIGRWEGIRIVESPLREVPADVRAGPVAALTLRMVDDVVRRMARLNIPADDRLLLVHPSTARELRKTLPGMRVGKR